MGKVAKTKTIFEINLLLWNSLFGFDYYMYLWYVLFHYYIYFKSVQYFNIYAI